jgi:hypothetical protein
LTIILRCAIIYSVMKCELSPFPTSLQLPGELRTKVASQLGALLSPFDSRELRSSGDQTVGAVSLDWTEHDDVLAHRAGLVSSLTEQLAGKTADQVAEEITDYCTNREQPSGYDGDDLLMYALFSMYLGLRRNHSGATVPEPFVDLLKNLALETGPDGVPRDAGVASFVISDSSSLATGQFGAKWKLSPAGSDCLGGESTTDTAAETTGAPADPGGRVLKREQEVLYEQVDALATDSKNRLLHIRFEQAKLLIDLDDGISRNDIVVLQGLVNETDAHLRRAIIEKGKFLTREGNAAAKLVHDAATLDEYQNKPVAGLRSAIKKHTFMTEEGNAAAEAQHDAAKLDELWGSPSELHRALNKKVFFTDQGRQLAYSRWLEIMRTQLS